MRREEYILLLGHGHRDPEGQREFLRLTDLVQDRIHPKRVQAAFLELCAPSTAEGIRSCVEAGARKILAIPVFLNNAAHVKEDLPAQLGKARAQYPHIIFLYGRPIGRGQPVQEILLERLFETVGPEELASRAVLLVGRGTSDRQAAEELLQLGESLRNQVDCLSLTVSFVDQARPTVQEGLDTCRKSGARGIVILPYLLFSGAVLDKIQQAANGFRVLHPSISLTEARCLGSHPRLADLVMERIYQCQSESEG